MPSPWIQRHIGAQLRSLPNFYSSTNPSPHRLTQHLSHPPAYLLPFITRHSFSTTHAALDWLAPKRGETKKSPKGRPRVPTGGSMRGTTVVWGQYGLRMVCHDQRIAASQLKVAEDTIRKRMRGEKYWLYKRICANIGVYKKGNDQRMGKGKGSFDHWASRVSVGKVVFELRGEAHEVVVRDAFRLAGNKLPGLWEFIKRGDPPMMGMTKIGSNTTVEYLKRPRKRLPVEVTAERLPAAVSSPNSGLVDATQI